MGVCSDRTTEEHRCGSPRPLRRPCDRREPLLHQGLNAYLADLRSWGVVQIPTGFLAPLPPPPRVTAEPPVHKGTYDSLITKLKLHDAVKHQEAELAGSGKGKATERRLNEEWKGLSLQEKKERMVLQARKSVASHSMKSRVHRDTVLIISIWCFLWHRSIIDKDNARLATGQKAI